MRIIISVFIVSILVILGGCSTEDDSEDHVAKNQELVEANNSQPVERNIKLDDIEIVPYQETAPGELFLESKDTFAAQRTFKVDDIASFSIADNCTNQSESCESSSSVFFKTPTESGIYWARVEKNDVAHTFPFSVVDDSHERKACLLMNTFTWQAYSSVGGINFYKPPYDAPVTVSLNRPIKANSQSPHGYSFPIYRLMKQVTHDVLAFDDLYLHENPSLLADRCEYLVISQHAEYWTSEQLAQVREYVNRGGRLINFSANIAYWRVAYTAGSITVNKERSVLKSNRFSIGDPSIKDFFGIYYQGYPIKRYAKTNEEYLEKYPTLSTLKELEYELLGQVHISKPDHYSLRCIDQGQFKTLSGDFLNIELDGAVLKKYVKGTKVPIVEAELEDIDGSILIGWSAYGRDLRQIVLARDVKRGKGGVLSYGSIGWAHSTLSNKNTKNITLQALAQHEGVTVPCES